MAKLALAALESWLWDSANILRVVSIVLILKITFFGLLFLKRVNDVFDEEMAQVKLIKTVESAKVEFNYSSFRIIVNPDVKIKPATRKAIEFFYKEKASEKNCSLSRQTLGCAPG